MGKIKSAPKIEVFIPSYNGEKYIGKAIQSLLNQTYTDFYLHIVDNSSKDDTLKIVKEIKDKRIIIHKNKRNIGMFSNMNKCLSIAKASYVKILCCDDILDPKCLEKQVNILEKNSRVSLVFGSSSVISAEGKPFFRRRFFSSDLLIPGEILIKKILKSGRNPIGEPSSIMLRRDIITKKKIIFDKSFSYISDLDMWIKILKHGDGYYIDELLSSFRIHESSATSKLLKKMVKEHISLMKRYGKEFNVSRLEYFIYNVRLLFFFSAKFMVYKLFVR